MPAEIIPFPPRRTDTSARSTEVSLSPDARLQQSLIRLQAATDQQRHAIAGWRKALSELKTSMHALDGSMQRYRLRLETLRAGVNGVRQGKVIELDLAATDEAAAEATVKTMCEKLLANTVIESYKVEIL